MLFHHLEFWPTHRWTFSRGIGLSQSLVVFWAVSPTSAPQTGSSTTTINRKALSAVTTYAVDSRWLIWRHLALSSLESTTANSTSLIGCLSCHPVRLWPSSSSTTAFCFQMIVCLVAFARVGIGTANDPVYRLGWTRCLFITAADFDSLKGRMTSLSMFTPDVSTLR